MIFLHEVRKGAADRSYGVQVARLAGLPSAVVERARDILHQLESGEDQGAGRPAALLDDLPLSRAAPPLPAPAAPAKTAASAVEDRLRGLNPDAISAREALNLLYELREMLPESPAGSAR